MFYTVLEKINDKTNRLFHLLGITEPIFRFYGNLNFFKSRYTLLNSDLPVYDFILSQRDVDYFYKCAQKSFEQGYKIPECSKYFKVDLIYNGGRKRVSMALHGDRYMHWAYKKKSFHIKTTDLIDGMSRINFIIPWDWEFIAPAFSNKLLAYLGEMNFKNDFVLVKFNGVLQGIYYMEEKLSKEFLEKNKMPDFKIIKLTDNWIENHPHPYANFQITGGITTNNEHITPFDFEISNLNIDNDSYSQKVVFAVNELYDAIKNEDIGFIKERLDLEQVSTEEAWRTLLNTGSNAGGDALKLIFDITSGKFYIVPHSESFFELINRYGGFEHSLNFHYGEKFKLFSLLTKDDELRNMRNKKLYGLLQNEDEIIKIYDELDKKYTKYFISDKNKYPMSPYVRKRIKESRENLKNNFNVIRSNFNYSKCYINVIKNDKNIKIDIIPDSNTALVVDKFKINSDDLTSYFKGKFSLGLNDELYPEKRVYSFIIPFEKSIKGIEVKIRNDITNCILDDDEIYIVIADRTDFYTKQLDLSCNEFTSQYPEWNFKCESNKLILDKGNYILNDNMIIPKKLIFNINEGVNIVVNENKSIISYSPVNILGTKQNPVIIKSLDKSFGSFGIVGDKNCKSNINYLDISNGYETYINGMFFSGALSIYHCDLEMKNSIIRDNNADDGLIVKYSDVFIDNNNFHDNFADQFDCDFCTGIIKNSNFRNSKVEGGDGLDFSGSKIIVFNNRFSNLKDKGISIGEETDAIVYNNNLINNNISIEVKDSSNVFIINNILENNNIAVNLYRKKNIFNGGNAYLYDNDFVNNKEKYAKDKESIMYNINFRNNDYNDFVENIDNLENSFKIMEKYYASLEK